MTVSSKASKSSHHSRFIPREEIGAVAAWTFHSMDLPEDIPAPEPVPQPEPPGIDEATLQAAREAAHAEGFAQGHEAGAREVREAQEATVRKAAEETAVRMGQLLHSTREHLSRSEEQIARQLLELACDLARQVVRAELSSTPETLRTVVNEALALAVEDGRPAILRVHPQDADWLQTGWTDGPATVKLLPDDSIAPGGCVLESTQATVDATVEKRWARAVANLGLQAPWKPGEQADV